jgi:tryptophan 2,3-dioxygenase
MLFIVQHQTSELWLKLLIHELRAALDHLRNDRVWQFGKVLARCKKVLRPADRAMVGAGDADAVEYMEFRDMLGPSSGFQSLQYRTIEFLLGNKNAAMLKVFAHDAAGHAALQAVLLVAPSLYDEFLRYLARWGHAVPLAPGARLVAAARACDPALVPVFERIYEDTGRYWREYALCEDLVDLETQFQLWRFRHMRTVMRIIGFKPGTGGSSGVAFLRKALELTFFPELFEVRTAIGPTRDYGAPDLPTR